MDTFSKFIIPAIIFLFTLASGVVLSRAGKPLNTFIFTIHKLIALAGVILTGLAFYNLFKIGNPQGLIIVLIAAAILCIIALFASGALMSSERPGYEVILILHKITTVLAPVSLAAALTILAGID